MNFWLEKSKPRQMENLVQMYMELAIKRDNGGILQRKRTGTEDDIKANTNQPTELTTRELFGDDHEYIFK